LAKGEKRIQEWIRTRQLPSPGGQADVFIAFHESDTERQRPYVLKQFRNPKRIARYRKEVKAVLELEHPGIVKVTHYSFGDDHPFLVTSFYPKGHLKQEHVRHLSPVEKLGFFAKICRAVGYAHENRVVHRDVKPENVLVSDEGDPLLTDFGLCWFQDEHEDRATQTWEQVGSRFYMAPELAHGRADSTAIAPVADVYSLGKVLYWMFAGTIFDREEHQAPRFDLRGKEPRVAHSLVYQLLDKSIVEKPEERFFRNGTQFADAVEACAQILSMEGHVLDLTVPQPCLYCRAGNYEIKVDPRWWDHEKYGLVQDRMAGFETQARETSEAFGFVFQKMWPRLVLRCSHCGSIVTFQFSRDARAPLQNWKFPETPRS